MDRNSFQNTAILKYMGKWTSPKE